MSSQELITIVGDVIPIVTTFLSAWLAHRWRSEQPPDTRSPGGNVETIEKELDG